MKQATIVVALAVLLLLAGVVFAQSGGPYDLSWHTVDGGGGTSDLTGLGDLSGLDLDTRFCLSGTLGQPDAGVLAGGGYTLGGGFWGGGSPAQTPAGYDSYLPLVLR